MKIIYIIVFVLAMYSVVSVIRFKYVISQAKLPSIAQQEQTFGQGPNLRYIASGDSTSAGVGASTTNLTYPYRIAQELSQTNTILYKNVGVSGAKLLT